MKHMQKNKVISFKDLKEAQIYEQMDMVKHAEGWTIQDKTEALLYLNQELLAFRQFWLQSTMPYPMKPVYKFKV